MSQHHDPVHPDSGHLTPELLADLDEGLLDVESSTHANAHLSHCDQCQQLHRDLHEVVAGLGALPAEAMPDAVWQQLGQSLDSGTGAAATIVVPLEAAASRRGRWAGRTLGAVGVAAGVLFIGFLVVPGLLDNSSDDSSSGTAGAEGQPESATEGAGTDLSQYAVTRSGNQYQSERLDSQVTQLVAARASGPVTNGSLSTDSEPDQSPVPSEDLSDSPPATYGTADARTSLFLSAAAVRICLEQYLYAPDLEPLAIDIGRWEGKTAAIVVLPVIGNPEKIEVWVIDPACADNPEGDVTVWHYQRLDAP